MFARVGAEPSDTTAEAVCQIHTADEPSSGQQSVCTNVARRARRRFGRNRYIRPAISDVRSNATGWNRCLGPTRIAGRPRTPTRRSPDAPRHSARPAAGFGYRRRPALGWMRWSFPSVGRSDGTSPLPRGDGVVPDSDVGPSMMPREVSSAVRRLAHSPVR